MTDSYVSQKAGCFARSMWKKNLDCYASVICIPAPLGAPE